MKALLVLSLLTFIPAHAETLLTEKQCLAIAGDISIGDFSPDVSGNSVIYNEMGLNNKLGVEYINKSRTELDKHLSVFCKTSDPTLEGLSKNHHDTCSSICQTNARLIFKDPMWGENTKKMNADTACLIICNRSRNKIDAMITGANIGKNLAAKDCNGQVSNASRDFKPTILDGALGIERSFNETKNK